MTLTLPIPPIELSPNGKCHWGKKAKLAKKAKAAAILTTLQKLNGGPRPCPVAYTLHYYWPLRRRDDDNAIASAKWYLDGICHALGIDDAHIRFRHLLHSADRHKPRLEITLHLAAP